MSITRKSLKVLLVIGVLLAAIRLALPYALLHVANNSLANMKGYHGHIQDIDLAIIRGAYKIDSAYLNKVDSVTKKETPFLAASSVDLSIEWKALLKGSLAGEVVFEDPLVRFTKDKVEPKDVRKDSTYLKKMFDDFMPLKINRFTINNGSIQYIDEFSKPKVDVSLTQAHVVGLNLINSYDSTSILPASITAKANVYNGTLDLTMKLNTLAASPTFDMNAELKDTDLVKLNDFFKAYAKADVNKGTFGMYTEIAAKEGKFAGYVKPFIKDLDVLGKEDRKDNVFQKLWEGLVGSTSKLLKNPGSDKVATKIPFRGDMDNPKTNIWYAVVHVLQNAFIRAINPSLDQDINIETVPGVKTASAEKKEKKKNFFNRLFGKKDRKKKHEEKTKG
jgi:hypothetical protein